MHPVFIDVILIFSQVPGPIQVCFRNELVQLILMNVTFFYYKDALQYQQPWWPCHVQVSLHFAQNYPRSESKTLHSWCRALLAFYQTSLLSLCNIFCCVYEKNLKRLEIDNISSVSTHEPKSSDKFFRFHLQRDVY